MSPEIRYFPVNWVDGMKISKKQFMEFENFVNDQDRDAIGLFVADQYYGLLPAGALSSLEHDISFDQNQNIKVFVRTCRAVTANGSRIEIINNERIFLNVLTSEIITSYNLQPSKELIFYVIISVNPFVRTPVGEPAIDEIPPRHPFTQPGYALSIIPAENINSAEFTSSHLIIGKLSYSNGVLKADSGYIPACMSIKSFPLMSMFYASIGNSLNGIHLDSGKIIQKIKLKSQKNSLTDSIYFLVEKLFFHSASHMDHYRWIISKQPPVFMYELILRLLQTLKTAFDCLIEKEKEEVLAYFAEWADKNPGAIESKLNSVLSIPYDHIGLADIFKEFDDFLKFLSDLFNRLSQLEYIGKRKGQSVFITETPVYQTPIEKPKSRFSPL